MTLFHTVDTFSGNDYTFSVGVSSDNLVKISYSYVGVWIVIIMFVAFLPKKN